MKVDIVHSTVQYKTVIKFFSLNDYYKCIEFLDDSNLNWEALTYSSRLDKASIRVDEKVLLIITKKYRLNNGKDYSDLWPTGMR